MKLEYIKIADENKFLVKKENIYFSVTETMFLILEKHQLNWSMTKIANFLNTNQKTDFYTDEVIKSILNDGKIQKILSDTESVESKSNYIFLKVKLLDPQKISGLLNILSNYFLDKSTMYFLSLVGIFITLFYGYFFYDSILSIQNQFNSTILEQIPQMIAVYLLFISIIFIHELGHTSAAYKFGVTPKQIGFGFYYTMPVLFTELTEIWRLKRKEKIVVNIAGIYFQIILNCLIILGLLFFPSNTVLNVLFITNTFSLLFALNPFFKNDGYWIFSDYFNLTNLETKADKCFINLFRFLYQPKKTLTFFKNKATILIIYSSINIAFWVYFFYNTTKYMILNAEIHYNSLLKNIDLLIIGKIVLYLFFLYMFLKSTYTRIKSILIDKD